VYNPDTVCLKHVHQQLVFCVLGKDAVQGNCLEESKNLVFQQLQAGATITYRNAKGGFVSRLVGWCVSSLVES